MLEVARLDVLVRRLLNSALAPSTIRAYTSAQTRYADFCSVTQLPLLPLTESGLCRFSAWLAAQSVSARTIKSYLSALRYLQIQRMGHDPQMSSMASLHYVLQGVKRSQALAGANTPRTRLPITTDIMRLLKRSWEARGIDFTTVMLWAVACTCFFGFLRSGEATLPAAPAYDPGAHLSISDVSVDSPTSPTKICVRIKASKTDPFRQGVTICLGRTGQELCPVGALLSYIARRGLSPGPLFRYEGGQPLTYAALVGEVRTALQAAGLDPSQYAGHSFRVGAATSAAAAGVEDALIKILGRWKSSAYTGYVQIPRESLAGVSVRLAAQ